MLEHGGHERQRIKGLNEKEIFLYEQKKWMAENKRQNFPIDNCKQALVSKEGKRKDSSPEFSNVSSSSVVEYRLPVLNSENRILKGKPRGNTYSMEFPKEKKKRTKKKILILSSREREAREKIGKHIKRMMGLFLIDVDVRVFIVINIVVLGIGETCGDGSCRSHDADTHGSSEMIRRILHHRIDVLRPLRFVLPIGQLVDIVFQRLWNIRLGL